MQPALRPESDSDTLMARQAAGAGGHQANLNCVIVSWTGPGQTHITHNPGLIPRDIAGHVSPSSLPELTGSGTEP